MSTKEQIKNGLLKYLDAEVIPNLPSVGKWGAGTAIVLLTANYDKVFASIVSSEVVKALNVVDGEQRVDIETLFGALKQSAEKYGKMQVSIPIIGTMYFSSEDVDKLRDYIRTESIL